MFKRLLISAIALLSCSWAMVVWAGPVFPEPTSYLVDQADLLTADQESTLEQELNDYKASTTHEIAVVTMPDLGGLTPADYAQQLWAKWGIGVAGRDNGVLLLVGVAEDRIRIQTGRGVEDVLPDVEAGRIIREDMRPLYNAGQRGEAIVTGTRAIMAELLTAPAAPVDYTDYPSSYAPTPWYRNIDPGLMIAIGMFAFFIGLFSFLAWLDQKAGRKGKKSSWDDWGSNDSSWGNGSPSSSSSSSSSSSDWGSSSDSSSSGSSFGGYGGGSSGGGGADG